MKTIPLDDFNYKQEDVFLEYILKPSVNFGLGFTIGCLIENKSEGYQVLPQISSFASITSIRSLFQKDQSKHIMNDVALLTGIFTGSIVMGAKYNLDHISQYFQ